MKNISVLTALSEEAYRAKDFERAKPLLDEIIDQVPETPEGLGSRHLRAMAYEFGNMPGGVDLDKALEDYKFLADKSEALGSDGLVGCARVLCELDMAHNFEKVKQSCLRAIEIDGDVRAKMLLGYMYAEARQDLKTARKWFLSAFKDGSYWGMKYFAATHLKEGNFIRGAAFHAIAFMSSVLPFSKKSKSPYH